MSKVGPLSARVNIFDHGPRDQGTTSAGKLHGWSVLGVDGTEPSCLLFRRISGFKQGEHAFYIESFEYYRLGLK